MTETQVSAVAAGQFEMSQTTIVSGPLSQLIDRARVAQNAGELSTALPIWEYVKDHYPHDPRGYVGTGTVLRDLKRFDEADAVLSQGRLKFPGDERFAVARAWMLHARGAWRDANIEWSDLRTRSPGIFDGYLGGGAALRSLGSLDEADIVFRRAIERFPIHLGLLAEFATTAQARGDATEAAKRWTTVHTLFPNNLDAMLGETRALLGSGLYADAEAALALAVDRFPKALSALVPFAQMAELRRDWYQAWRRWEQVTIVRPEQPEGFLGAANALSKLGRHSEAQVTLQPALRMSPDSPAILAMSARADHTAGRYVESVARWELYRKKFPGHVAGYVGGATALNSAGREVEAASLLDECLDLFPREPEPAALWARQPELDSQWDKAVERWEKMLGNFPESASIAGGHARALLRAGRCVEAEQLLRAAVTKFENSPEVTQAHAECALQRREWIEAERRWQPLLESTDNPEVCASAGNAMRLAGRLETAERVLRAGLDRFPEDLHLRQELAQTLTEAGDWVNAMPLWASLRSQLPQDPAIRAAVAHAYRLARMKPAALPLEAPALQRVSGVSPALRQ